MILPPPVIERHNGLDVVRDDLLPAGTKMRFILPYLLKRPESTFVYASPAMGYAQVALAKCCQILGKQAVIFTAKRKEPSVLTKMAKDYDARIFMVPYGYLNVVQSRAKQFANDHGAHLIPFGCDLPDARQHLVTAAQSLTISPKEVWTCAGSGTLTRSLQEVWPKADFYAVLVGKKDSDIGSATRIIAKEKFESPCKSNTPFNSSLYYDAKAWQVAKVKASMGALFWNVA